MAAGMGVHLVTMCDVGGAATADLGVVPVVPVRLTHRSAGFGSVMGGPVRDPHVVDEWADCMVRHGHDTHAAPGRSAFGHVAPGHATSGGGPPSDQATGALR